MTTDAELIRRQSDLEDRCSENVRRLARELVEAAGPTWAWGDGSGGWLINEVVKAALELGVEPPTPPIPPSGREKARRVFERDAYRCLRCGTWLDLTIDHIVPRSRGGTDDLHNLQTLCRSCNSWKGDR